MKYTVYIAPTKVSKDTVKDIRGRFTDFQEAWDLCNKIEGEERESLLSKGCLIYCDFKWEEGDHFSLKDDLFEEEITHENVKTEVKKEIQASGKREQINFMNELFGDI